MDTPRLYLAEVMYHTAMDPTDALAWAVSAAAEQGDVEKSTARRAGGMVIVRLHVRCLDDPAARAVARVLRGAIAGVSADITALATGAGRNRRRVQFL